MSTKYNLSEAHKEHLKVFREIIGKCRGIVGFFNHTDINQHVMALDPKQNGKSLKQLIQEVSTRWNSTYAMVKRIHEQVELHHMNINNKEK